MIGQRIIVFMLSDMGPAGAVGLFFRRAKKGRPAQAAHERKARHPAGGPIL